MYQEQAPYGLGILSSHLPTIPATRYLNCCLVAGWHQCNAAYHQCYRQGVPPVLVLFTVAGEGWLRTGDCLHPLTAGSIAVIPPHTPMEYATSDTSAKKSAACWEFYWLNLDGAYVRQVAASLWEDGCTVCTLRQPAAYLEILQALLSCEDSAITREWERSRLIAALFDHLLEERFFGNDAHDRATDVADALMVYLRTHYDQPLTLSQLSRQFYLSANQLLRLFHARTGYAPYEYLKRYRLLKACELLQSTTLAVQEVGRRTGYTNSSHFSAQFRALYGLSPSAYRRHFAPQSPAPGRPFMREEHEKAEKRKQK